MFTDEITERKAKLNKLCTEQNLALVIGRMRRFAVVTVIEDYLKLEG
ncbi:MAG: hypothetical protein LBR72_05240 [Oscillospiraceae bacterium]|jgi:hypothetical protein|nr:hypothetical protein [Oscillospiraceae bacterium]